MDKAEEMQSGFDVANEESGADTSLIREYISSSKQKDVVPKMAEQAKVEQSAEKYSSWLIY